MVQVALALSLVFALHGVVPVGPSIKFPLVAMLESVTVAVLTFFTVTICGVPVVPNAWLPNVTVAGENVSGAAWPFLPVPESATVCCFTMVVSATVTAPRIAPFAVGVNVTDMVHLAPAARLVPQGELPLPTAV